MSNKHAIHIFVGTIFICLTTVCEGTPSSRELNDSYSSCTVNLECIQSGIHGSYCCGNCHLRFCCNSSIYQVDFVDCLDQLHEEENSKKTDVSKTLLIVVGSVAASLIFVITFQGFVKRICSSKYNRRRNGVANPCENTNRLENGCNRITTRNDDNGLPSYRDLHYLKNDSQSVNPPNYYSLPGIMNSVEERKIMSDTVSDDLTGSFGPPSYSSAVSSSDDTTPVPTISANVI